MLTFLRRAAFHTLDKGKAFDRFIYLLNDAGDKVSFWNDVPLKPKGSDPEIFNMIVEMPRYTLAKLELARDHKHHPIMHDLRQNIFNPEVTELRYYAQFGNWNYGLLPQTWESVLVNHEHLGGVAGDNDPLDVLEVSNVIYKPGQIIEVKIIGGFACIDQGELDWKILSVEKNEAAKNKINSIADLERMYPSQLADCLRWFKVCKTFDRKKPNIIAFDEKIFEKAEILDVIQENHLYWKELFSGIPAPERKDQPNYTEKLQEIRKEFQM